LNTQFSVSIHILSLLGTNNIPMSSQYIADSINSNATLVRKLCRHLKEGHYLQSSQGVTGYRLTCPTDTIRLGDLYQLIFSNTDHFAKIHGDSNVECHVGKNISHALDKIYTEVDQSIVNKLNTFTIKDVINQL